jgi:hypothetical protein
MESTSSPSSVVFGRAFGIATSAATVRRALQTSLVVGTVLNLVNQPEALLGGAQLVPLKMLITYLVPYCVSTYTAVMVTLRERAGA